MTFSKYGYSFILNPSYDRIRQQLLNPDNRIYPSEFWFQAPFPKEIYGVPFIMEENLEAILPIFSLKSKSSERPFATIIPLTSKPIEETILELKNRFKESSKFNIALDSMGPNVNYLTDLEAITNMITWIESKKCN